MNSKRNLQLPQRILRTGDLETENIKNLACNDKSNFVIIHGTTLVLYSLISKVQGIV